MCPRLGLARQRRPQALFGRRTCASEGVRGDEGCKALRSLGRAPGPKDQDLPNRGSRIPIQDANGPTSAIPCRIPPCPVALPSNPQIKPDGRPGRFPQAKASICGDLLTSPAPAPRVAGAGKRPMQLQLRHWRAMCPVAISDCQRTR